MSQQPPYGQPPPRTTKPPHRYRGWVLTAFVLTYLASLVFLFTEIVAKSGIPTPPESSSSSSAILTSLTTLLILVLFGFILVLDWRNVFSLFGRIHWKQLNGWKRVGLIFLYLCVFIIPGLYLYFATQYFLGIHHQTPGSALSGVWSSYRAKSGTAQLGIALVTTLVLLSFVGLTGAFAVIDRESALTSSAITPTTAPTLVLGVTETPTQPATLLNPTDTPTATPQPTPKPTLRPTQAPVRPTPIPPTPRPTSPSCQAVHNNPWCYTFVQGKPIYYPPSRFCNYFSCIPSFYGSDDPGDGYIVECNDGTYSQSGGEKGACSYHSGVMRPLYSH